VITTSQPAAFAPPKLELAVAKELRAVDPDSCQQSGRQHLAGVVGESAALRNVESAFGNDQHWADVLGDPRVAKLQIACQKPRLGRRSARRYGVALRFVLIAASGR
jgi:hypothetical protein